MFKRFFKRLLFLLWEFFFKKTKCQSKNHKGHYEEDEELWRCLGCRRVFCLHEGAADDMPDHCDDCWAAAHSKAA